MTVSNPKATASLRSDNVSAGLTPEKLLIVGSMLSSGTATSGALVENILNDGSEDGYFGEASPLAAAIRRARRRNRVTQIDAIGMEDDGAATASTGAVVFTGAATAAGTITVYVGSKKFNKYELTIADSDSATTIGDALVTAITADSKALVTAVNTTGSVALTAKTKGTFGDTLGIKIEGSVAGVTAAATAMGGGATDPTLTGIFDVVGNQRYQGIVWQFTSAAGSAELIDFLDARLNVTNEILDGRGFTSLTSTFAGLLSILGSQNSSSAVINVDKIIDTSLHRGPYVLEVPFVKAAEFAATRALRRTLDSTLGSLVIARSTLDSFGGPWQNSKPYFNTPFPDLELPDVGGAFEETEIDQLRDAGGWVIDANRSRTEVIAGEVVTTYKTDSAGNDDPTFGYLNYVDTATAAREYIVNNTRAKYPQYRATGGALIPGVDSANEASVAAFVTELYAELGDLGLVSTGVGTLDGEKVDYDKSFRENLTVTLNPTTGKFLVGAKLFIVTQFRDATYDLAVSFEV